ncbi:hypothetical protein OG930_35150 [Streptomyces sp. NBC_01799]|nr:hypothetical protein OG930_35150 [Streptomyces sp. NBC_01799]
MEDTRVLTEAEVNDRSGDDERDAEWDEGREGPAVPGRVWAPNRARQ